MRWRRGPRTSFGPRTHELWDAENRIATAQECAGGWFWYGDGINTARNPDTLANVKAEAIEHFRTAIQRQQ